MGFVWYVPVWWWSRWWGGDCVRLGCSGETHSRSGTGGPVRCKLSGRPAIALNRLAGTGHKRSHWSQTLLLEQPQPVPIGLWDKYTETCKHTNPCSRNDFRIAYITYMDNYGAFFVLFWNLETSTVTTNNEWNLTRVTWLDDIIYLNYSCGISVISVKIEHIIEFFLNAWNQSYRQWEIVPIYTVTINIWRYLCMFWSLHNSYNLFCAIS